MNEVEGKIVGYAARDISSIMIPVFLKRKSKLRKVETTHLGSGGTMAGTQGTWPWKLSSPPSLLLLTADEELATLGGEEAKRVGRTFQGEERVCAETWREARDGMV